MVFRRAPPKKRRRPARRITANPVSRMRPSDTTRQPPTQIASARLSTNGALTRFGASTSIAAAPMSVRENDGVPVELRHRFTLPSPSCSYGPRHGSRARRRNDHLAPTSPSRRRQAFAKTADAAELLAKPCEAVALGRCVDAWAAAALVSADRPVVHGLRPDAQGREAMGRMCGHRTYVAPPAP